MFVFPLYSIPIIKAIKSRYSFLHIICYRQKSYYITFLWNVLCKYISRRSDAKKYNHNKVFNNITPFHNVIFFTKVQRKFITTKTFLIKSQKSIWAWEKRDAIRLKQQKYFQLFSRARIFFSRGRLLGNKCRLLQNNARVLNSRGWLLRNKLYREKSLCQTISNLNYLN